MSYGWENFFLHLFRFGCYEGELRPGLFGWSKEKAEVLELLAFWKPEQQAAHRFRIWRPLASPSYKFIMEKSKKYLTDFGEVFKIRNSFVKFVIE